MEQSKRTIARSQIFNRPSSIKKSSSHSQLKNQINPQIPSSIFPLNSLIHDKKNGPISARAISPINNSISESNFSQANEPIIRSTHSQDVISDLGLS